MKIRLYQIVSARGADELYLNSAALEKLQLEKFGYFTVIDSSIYDEVFNGEVNAIDLDDVFTIFNTKPPEGFKGRSMSVSDVVEVFDVIGVFENENVKASSFFFCDSCGFKEVDFNPELACKGGEK